MAAAAATTAVMPSPKIPSTDTDTRRSYSTERSRPTSGADPAPARSADPT